MITFVSSIVSQYACIFSGPMFSRDTSVVADVTCNERLIIAEVISIIIISSYYKYIISSFPVILLNCLSSTSSIQITSCLLAQRERCPVAAVQTRFYQPLHPVENLVADLRAWVAAGRGQVADLQVAKSSNRSVPLSSTSGSTTSWRGSATTQPTTCRVEYLSRQIWQSATRFVGLRGFSTWSNWFVDRTDPRYQLLFPDIGYSTKTCSEKNSSIY